MGHDVELFKKAELAIKKRNLDYAIELILQGLLINPRATEQRRRLHQIETLAVQEKGGKPEGSIGSKMKALPHESKAKKLQFQKKYEESVIELEKAVRHQPRATGTLFQLAKMLQQAEIQGGAIGVYQEIVEIDNTLVEAYRALGNLFSDPADKDHYDPEKAIEYWEKLKQFKPDDKEAGKRIRDLSAAVMVQKQEERKKRAADRGESDDFRILLKDEDESEELQKQKQIIRNDEDRVRVIKMKMAEIKKDPTNTQNSRTFREIGALFFDLKKWDQADKSFRNALKLNPNDLFAQERMGQLAEARLVDELDKLKAKIDGNGSEDPALVEELNAKELKLRAFRLTEYKRRVEAHPTDYKLKFDYGVQLKEAGQHDLAIQYFQQAIKDPKFKVGCKKEIGDCFVAKGLFDMAVSQYDDALSEISDKESDLWKEIKYNLALASEHNGDPKSALQHYQEIMAIDIGYQDIASRVSDLRKPGTVAE